MNDEGPKLRQPVPVHQSTPSQKRRRAHDDGSHQDTPSHCFSVSLPSVEREPSPDQQFLLRNVPLVGNIEIGPSQRTPSCNTRSVASKKVQEPTPIRRPLNEHFLERFHSIANSYPLSQGRSTDSVSGSTESTTLHTPAQSSAEDASPHPSDDDHDSGQLEWAFPQSRVMEFPLRDFVAQCPSCDETFHGIELGIEMHYLITHLFPQRYLCHHSDDSCHGQADSVHWSWASLTSHLRRDHVLPQKTIEKARKRMKLDGTPHLEGENWRDISSLEVPVLRDADRDAELIGLRLPELVEQLVKDRERFFWLEQEVHGLSALCNKQDIIIRQLCHLLGYS